jgi:hypothetical protein
VEHNSACPARVSRASAAFATTPPKSGTNVPKRGTHMEKVLKRFYNNISPEPMSGCWLWLGPCFKEGYANVFVKGKNALGHRFSYSVHNGPIPDGLQVNHICDNKNCVNPAHLYVGTQKQNVQDILNRKGFPPRGGSNSTTAKLDEDCVDFIRTYPTSRGSGVLLSKYFGVARSTISDILKGKLWK